MSRTIVFFTILFLILFAQCHLAAQVSEEPEPYQQSNLFGAKLLFIDHQIANQGEDLEVTNGIELSYHRALSRYFNLVFPLKIGTAKYVGELNNTIFGGVDGVFNFKILNDTNRVVPYLLAGAGVTFESMETANTQIPFGFGANYQVGEHSFINAQLEYRTSLADERNNFQLGMGLIYRFRKVDNDGDGVVDHLDACPEVPGVIALNGCPDRDGDNVTDAKDLCPDEPGRRVTDGCPDRDRDGITDADDPCPDEAGNFNGCPDSDGDGVGDDTDKCPEVAGIIVLQGCPDSDGDGIADVDDQCPQQVGVVANNGCPFFDTDNDGVDDDTDLCPNERGSKATGGCPDRDRDGVADKDDRCPDKAGPFTGCPDTDGDGIIDADDACPEQAGITANKGCPELEAAEKEVLEIAMQAVQFETGKANLIASSNAVLDQIVDILKKYPGYKLRISGHTDNTGDPNFNQELSEFRALACYDYIIGKGIDPQRLSYAGFGQTQPIADNRSRAGRRLNRRVEFELYAE